jgi:lipopolysaccharide export system protein LptA
MFVLTGTKAAPPKVVDAQQGTATGTSLRFHSGDDSVVISGARDGTSGQRARTQTKVKE